MSIKEKLLGIGPVAIAIMGSLILVFSFSAIFGGLLTDGGCGKLRAIGNAATVRCWSGGQLIYSGTSTGKVQSETSSDGYYFRDAKDGMLKEVSGDCIIEYQER